MLPALDTEIRAMQPHAVARSADQRPRRSWKRPAEALAFLRRDSEIPEQLSNSRKAHTIIPQRHPVGGGFYRPESSMYRGSLILGQSRRRMDYGELI